MNPPYKTSKSLVSVILPFYRPGSKLETAIKSIINQSFTKWELILVNNNACEISSAIACKWSMTDNRVTVIRESVQSVAHAMNTGLRHATTDLVARMDADDISLPRRLQRQVEYMDMNPETGAVATQTIFNTDIKRSKGFSLYVDWQNSLINHSEHYLAQFIESPLAQPTIMFRKKLIELFGYYNTGNIPEDYELWLRWFEKGVRFYKIPEPLVQWNDHRDRLTRTHSAYSEIAFQNIRYEYLARWLKKNITGIANHFNNIDIQRPEKQCNRADAGREETISNDKKIIVCGSSKNIIRKAAHLEKLGLKIHAYTDVRQPVNSKILFIPYHELTDSRKYFILNLISKRGVGNAIRDHFIKLGFVEGRDMLLAG